MSGDVRAHVPRPSLPPLLWLVAGLWAGIVLSEGLIWRHVALNAILTVTIPAAVGSAACARTRRWWAMTALGCCAGVLIGALFWNSLAEGVAGLEQRGSARLRGVAITDPAAGRFGERSKVVLASATGERIEVMWPQGDVPEAGQLVEFFGKLFTGGSDQWARRRHQGAVAATAKARSVRILGWSNTLQGRVGPWRDSAIDAVNRVPGPGGDLLGGVVLGDRRRLSGTQADADFRVTGLTHLVAVSGSHLVVVAALAMWVLGACRVPRWPTALVTASTVGLYVVATGVQSSALRAWGMAIVASLSSLSGRRSDAGAALAIAAGVALVAHPPVAFDLGFRLSVAAVAGLVVYARLVERWIAAGLPRVAEPLANPLALTFVAQAATAPITTAVFGTFSMIAPVANLFAGPLITFALVVGLAGIGADSVVTGVGTPLLFVAGAAGALTASIAGRLAQVPGASIGVDASVAATTLLMLSMAALVWMLWPVARPQSSRLGLAVLSLVVLVALAGPRPPSGATITALDVGQGDALLIRDGPSAVLVDAGPGGPSLAEALRRHGVRRLDSLVITHYHDDHYAGVEDVAGAVTIERVLVASQEKNAVPTEVARLRAQTSEVLAGARIDCGSVTLTVLSPQSRPEDPAANESSIVLLAQGPSRSALLTGDAEVQVVEPLLRQGALGNVDVLKVGHHGSAEAVTPQMLKAMSTRVALISCGAHNRHGHPHSQTLRVLERAGVLVRRTDLEGDITVPLDSTRSASSVAGTLPDRATCATLIGSQELSSRFPYRGADERCARPQTHLPHTERAGLFGSASRGPPERQGLERRRP